MKQLELDLKGILVDTKESTVDNTLESEVTKKTPVKATKKALTKKEKLAEVAKGCRKMTGWLEPKRTVQKLEVDMLWEDSPAPLNPDMIVRLELVKRKKRTWETRSMVGDLIKELVDDIEPSVEVNKIIFLVLDRAWKSIKELEAWKWLGGDLDLQKSMVRRIRMEEEEILRQRAEDRLLMRIQKKVELELLWKERRAKEKEFLGPDVKDANEVNVDILEECMKGWTLAVELEDADGCWMEWESNRLPQSGVAAEHLAVTSFMEVDGNHIPGRSWLEDRSWRCRGLEEWDDDYGLAEHDDTIKEVLEHAFLEFMEIDLGLGSGNQVTSG